MQALWYTYILWKLSPGPPICRPGQGKNLVPGPHRDWRHCLHSLSSASNWIDSTCNAVESQKLVKLKELHFRREYSMSKNDRSLQTAVHICMRNSSQLQTWATVGGRYSGKFQLHSSHSLFSCQFQYCDSIYCCYYDYMAYVAKMKTAIIPDYFQSYRTHFLSTMVLEIDVQVS